MECWRAGKVDVGSVAEGVDDGDSPHVVRIQSVAPGEFAGDVVYRSEVQNVDWVLIDALELL